MNDKFGAKLNIGDECIKLEYDSFNGIQLRLAIIEAFTTNKVKIRCAKYNDVRHQTYSVYSYNLIKSDTNIRDILYLKETKK